MKSSSKQEPRANQVYRRPPSSSAAAQILMQCRWPLALIGLALIAAIVGLIAWSQSQSAMRDAVGQASQAVNAVSDRAIAIAEKFRSGAITKTFVASLPKIENSGSGRLELAVLQSTETFRSEDNLRIGWNYVSLGTTDRRRDFRAGHLSLSPAFGRILESGSFESDLPRDGASNPPQSSAKH